MPFDVRVNRRPEFAQFELSGPVSIQSFVDLVGVVETETVFWSDRYALFDLRGIDGELSPDEQVFLGELVAQNLSHLDRLASVVPVSRITRRSEGAAQRMGVQLRVFADPEEAAQWLIEGHTESAFGLLQEEEGLKRLLNGREMD